MNRFVLATGLVLALAAAALVALVGGHASAQPAALPTPQPTVSDFVQMTTSEIQPTQAQCNSVGRRCFTPASTRASYNLNPLYAAGIDGRGMTIAIVDAYGSDTIAHDLNVYDTQMGLPNMCGEESVTCIPGMPTFSRLAIQGSPATQGPPPTSNGNGLQDKAAWALEVSLDVETAHSIAPDANILLVTTPTAETLGLQGFPQMMNAEDYVVKNHLAQVISQSFGTAELAFASTKSLLNLRGAFIDASQNGVTVLASSGDDGSAGFLKQSLLHSKKDSLIPVPTVGWPASDPLVTGVGGTYLCTNANTGLGIDNTSPPANCQNQSNREIGWIDSGGGFSNVFARPAFQTTLPAGSTPIPTSQRGVPDIALQASARTGALVYLTLPPDGQSGLICPSGDPCSTGWYDIGGTSLSAPQWAGIVALAAQVNGGGLGPINPGLYKIGADPVRYANDFYDVTTGNNQALPTIPGYPARPGWDPVTGLGTPNAANLVPDLVAAVHGH